MSETISAEQYRTIIGGTTSKVIPGPRARITYSAPKTGVREAQEDGDDSVISHRLRAISPKEESIHIQLCNYVRAKYPDAIFTSESSGIRLTMGQAVKAKKLRSSAKLPDFWLAEPRGTFAGLFLELKRSREEIYTVGGDLRGNEHIQGQEAILERLRLKGYAAGFAGGIDDAIRKVDTYMKS